MDATSIIIPTKEYVAIVQENEVLKQELCSLKRLLATRPKYNVLENDTTFDSLFIDWLKKIDAVNQEV